MDDNVMELVKFLVGSFVDIDRVDFAVSETEKSSEITAYLSTDDMGKVIGKEGKIVKAMRTLISAATPRGSKRVVLLIRDKEERDKK